MSEAVQPLLYADSRVAEIGSLFIAGFAGGITGVVGAAASENYFRPKEWAVRHDLGVQIDIQEAGQEAIKTELARRELGYPPHINRTTDELHASQHRITATVAQLHHEKAPLDQAHADFLTSGVLVGIAAALALRNTRHFYNQHRTSRQQESK